MYQILSDVKEGIAVLSRVPLLVTSWTVAHWAPLSMGFSRQEYCSELSFPPPGDLPNPGIEPSLLGLLHWLAGFFITEPPGKPQRGQRKAKKAGSDSV